MLGIASLGRSCLVHFGTSQSQNSPGSVACTVHAMPPKQCQPREAAGACAPLLSQDMVPGRTTAAARSHCNDTTQGMQVAGALLPAS